MTSSEEGLQEFWDHGHGTRACGLKSLRESDADDLLLARARGRSVEVERTQRTRKRVTAFALERAFGAETPGAAADLACPQGRSEKNPSRERETPRTDRGGRGKPAKSGSLRPTSLEGRETPGGSIRSGRTGEDVATRTLRGRRSLWKPSHRLRATRQADRRKTSRPLKRRGGKGNP
jgi:hypothetical protein